MRIRTKLRLDVHGLKWISNLPRALGVSGCLQPISIFARLSFVERICRPISLQELLSLGENRGETPNGCGKNDFNVDAVQHLHWEYCKVISAYLVNKQVNKQRPSVGRRRK